VLSAIVVNKDQVKTGALEGDALSGFLSAAAMVGLQVDDPQAFLRAQQKAIFDWAKTAPKDLGLVEESAPQSSGPRFVQYFTPVLDALRANGGEAKPETVFAWIKEHIDVPTEEIEAVNKGGQSKFENKVAWARFYLAKAGLIDGSKRGTWALTAGGEKAELDHVAALEMFRDVQARFKTTDYEDEAAPETVPGHDLFADPERRFWFVGAVWGGTDDQTERFLGEGIWQNGYDNKFAEHVARMRPGDRIAIKAAFVQKYNLPFDNLGKPVSCMRIKAVGTVTENLRDGKTVRVDWERLDPPRDWFFYTYRVTVVEADPSEELARRLILFAFAGAKQDYSYWINEVPYFTKKYGAVAKPASVEDLLDIDSLETEEEAAAPSYTVKHIADEGCFLATESPSKNLLNRRNRL
jgi:5-methylcytosine-specific restriction protein B